MSLNLTARAESRVELSSGPNLLHTSSLVFYITPGRFVAILGRVEIICLNFNFKRGKAEAVALSNRP